MSGLSDIEELLLFDTASTNWTDDCVKEIAFVCQCDEPTARGWLEETVQIDRLAKARKQSIADYYTKDVSVPKEFYSAIRAISGHVRYGSLFQFEMLGVLLRFTENEAPLHFQGAILDYGGGGGRDSIGFAKKGLRTTLAESSSFMRIDGPLILRRFKGRNLPVELVEAGTITAEDGFDYVSCMAVLEHCYDVEWVLSEITYKLKNGGYLFVWPDFDNVVYNGDHLEKNRFYMRSRAWPHLLKELGYVAIHQYPTPALFGIWHLQDKPRPTIETILKKAYQATQLWARRRLWREYVKSIVPWLNVRSVIDWRRIVRRGEDAQHPSIRPLNPSVRARQNLADAIHTLDLVTDRLRTLERN